MIRTLETLIEQFNKASEIDRFSRLATGETYWVEVDGIRTQMIDIWVSELSPEEKATFEAHVAQVMDETAKALGFENSKQQSLETLGKRIVKGVGLGVVAEAGVRLWSKLNH